MYHKYGLFLSILFLIFNLNPVHAREIINNGVLSAELKNDLGCRSGVDLIVNAPSIKYFSKKTSELEQFVTSAREKLNLECAHIRTMKIWGMVNKKRVYEATTAEHRGWKLIPAFPDRFEYEAKIDIKSPASRAPKTGLFAGKTWDRANKMSAERDGWGAFIQKIIHAKARPGEFHLIASSRRRDGPGVMFNFEGNSYAVCSELMSIKAQANPYLMDFDTYRKTRKGHDLPRELIDGFYFVRDALLEQCPELKVLRIDFETATADKTFNFTGTMTAASGWDLLDGTVLTEYESSREVRIKSRDINRPTGIDYTGTCEPSPILPLKPIYYNKTDEVWSKPFKLAIKLEQIRVGPSKTM